MQDALAKSHTAFGLLGQGASNVLLRMLQHVGSVADQRDKVSRTRNVKRLKCQRQESDFFAIERSITGLLRTGMPTMSPDAQVEILSAPADDAGAPVREHGMVASLDLTIGLSASTMGKNT